VLATHVSLIRSLLLPANQWSPGRLSHNTAATDPHDRRARLLHARLLRPLSPPTTSSQTACWSWVTGPRNALDIGLLHAGVVLHGARLRRRLVAGPLKDQLTAHIGTKRLAQALRYEGEVADLSMDKPDHDVLLVSGLAVMYRYARMASVDAGRRLLLRHAPDDPSLRASVAWMRRLPAKACVPIGEMVLESFDVIKEETT
jgi:hypothetical protein